MAQEIVPPARSFNLCPCRSVHITAVAAGDWIRPALKIEDFAIGKPKQCPRQVSILQHALEDAWLAVFLGSSLASANAGVMIHIRHETSCDFAGTVQKVFSSVQA